MHKNFINFWFKKCHLQICLKILNQIKGYKISLIFLKTNYIFKNFPLNIWFKKISLKNFPKKVKTKSRLKTKK